MMKALRSSLLILLAVCSAPLSVKPSHADVKVVVSSKPVHALTAAVMTGVGVPDLLVSGSASPHSYAMKPSDAHRVNTADVFIRVSEALEPFTSKLVASLPTSVAVVSLIDAPGLRLLKRRHGGAFEGHAHDHGHSHRRSDRAEHKHDVVDPHVWLDPDNAKVLVDYIAATLSDHAPQHAAAFRANAEIEKGKLDRLAADLARDLAALSDKPFIVYHDAYQYLEKRFGLEAVGSMTVSPDVPPSGKRLQNLRRTIRAKRAVCVFAEPHFESRVTNAVVEGTKAKTGTLDPEGTMLAPGPELYAILMRKLADDLRSCLAGN